MPRAGCSRPSMAAGSLARSGPGRSGRTSARRVQIVVHTGPIKLLGVQFGSKWVNVKPDGSKQSQVAPCRDQTATCQSSHWVSFTLRSSCIVLSAIQATCPLAAVILNRQCIVRRHFAGVVLATHRARFRSVHPQPSRATHRPPPRIACQRARAGHPAFTHSTNSETRYRQHRPNRIGVGPRRAVRLSAYR